MLVTIITNQMKKFLFSIIIVLTISCKNNNSNTEFRHDTDRLKKEKLPNEKFTVTTFEFDSIKDVKFFSEIKITSSFESKSINITTEYFKNDKLIQKIENGPFKNIDFLNQKIIVDKDGNKNLYFLLQDEKGAFIYEIKYINKNLITSRIESNDPQWIKLGVEINKE